MVKVVANNYVKSERLDEYLSIAKELVEKTNALDSGCIKYELCRDVNDPLHYVMLEEWENQESLNEHTKASHFLDLIPKLGDCTAKQGELSLLEKVF